MERLSVDLSVLDHPLELGHGLSHVFQVSFPSLFAFELFLPLRRSLWCSVCLTALSLVGPFSEVGKRGQKRPLRG